MASVKVERRDHMFPRLTEAQIARIGAVGRRREVKAGEILIQPWDQNTGTSS